MSNALFGGLMLLAVLSAPVAFVCVIFLYKKETARVGCLAYGLLLLVCAVVAYLFGLSLGINLACVQYPSGNLCGLFGFIATGPIICSLATVLLAWFLGRTSKSGR